MRRQLQISLALMLAGSAFVVVAQTSASSSPSSPGQASTPTPAPTGSAAPSAAAPAAPIEARVAMCIGCHGIPGYQTTFPEVYKVPMIAGQNAQYITAALQAYAKGDRKHPTMRSIAQSLTDRDIADISTYYSQQAKVAPVTDAISPPENIKALLDKGQCVTCHGANFNKPMDGAYPKIAGQHPDYLYAALKAYQTEGRRYVGRANATMATQVKQFNHTELQALAKYLASLPGELRTVPQSKFR